VIINAIRKGVGIGWVSEKNVTFHRMYLSL